jgi:hypothetical protein
MKLPSAGLSPLQRAIVREIDIHGPMTTLQLLQSGRLDSFWFLRARLYGAVDELVTRGVLVCVHTEYPPERGFRARRFYQVTKG